MGSFGDRMQREREMRSITLEEIAESTKIGVRMLRALEQEDFDKLPGGIFNKGFVRAYTRYLGLDEEQAVADFEKALEESRKKAAEAGAVEQANLFVTQSSSRPGKTTNIYAAAARSQEEPEPDYSAGFFTAAVILVILLGLGGFGWKLWGYYKQTQEQRVRQEEQLKLQQDEQKRQQELQVQQAKPSETNSSAPAAAIPADTDAAKTGNSGQASTAQSMQTNSKINQDAESGMTSVNKNAISPFQLEIRATARSWVQVKEDGKVLYDGVLTTGTSKHFTSGSALDVKLGYAGAVQLSFNGKPLPSFEPGTKEKILRFTPNGLAQSR